MDSIFLPQTPDQHFSIKFSYKILVLWHFRQISRKKRKTKTRLGEGMDPRVKQKCWVKIKQVFIYFYFHLLISFK